MVSLPSFSVRAEVRKDREEGGERTGLQSFRNGYDDIRSSAPRGAFLYLLRPQNEIFLNLMVILVHTRLVICSRTG